MKKQIVFVAAMSSVLSGTVHAVNLYSNIGAGMTPTNISLFTGELANATLEDVTFGASNPQGFAVQQINIGFDNTTAGPANFDVLVTLFNSVDYSQESIEAGLLAGPFRFNIVDAQIGANETGFMDFPQEILSADNTIGVSVHFVDVGTNTSTGTIFPMYKDVPIDFGSSQELFAHDDNNDGSFGFDERFTWEGGGFPAANLYLEVNGAAVVPEPASLALLGGAALVFRRRR